MNQLLSKGKLNRIFFLFFLILISPFNAGSQTVPANWYSQQIFMVSKVMEKYHYKPQELNDALSVKLNSEFIKTLDPSGLYFTKSDIEELSKWDNSLDDEIKNKSGKYLAEVSDLYRKRLIMVDSIISAIAQKPLNFNEKDTLHFLNKEKKISYAADEKSLAKRWTKWMKYQTLELLYTPKDKNEDPFTMDPNDVLKKEPDARAKIAARNKRAVKRIYDHPDGYDNYLSSQYINKFVSLFDPHTSFFSASEKQDMHSPLA